MAIVSKVDEQELNIDYDPGSQILPSCGTFVENFRSIDKNDTRNGWSVLDSLNVRFNDNVLAAMCRIRET
ncbi:unnamed protein product [Caenorhabditis nigoni]